MPPNPAPLLDRLGELLARAGGAQVQDVNETLHLAGSGNVWFVASGQLDLFLVRTEQDGVDAPWRHFLAVNAGALVCGLDFAGEPMGLYATCSSQARVCTASVGELLALAAEDAWTEPVIALLESWVATALAAVANEVRPAPKTGEALPEGGRVPLGAGAVVRAPRGVLWAEVCAGEGLYLSTELVAGSPDGPTLPLTPQGWLEIVDDAVLVAWDTRTLLGRGSLPSVLQRFHRALCRCAVVNRRLRLVDEYNQIRRRAEFGDWSREAALSDIASVLDGSERARAAIDRFADASDGLLAACRLVGESLALEIAAPPGLHRSRDKILAIANASRCRVRRVALRDRWWNGDHGPLLAFRTENHEAVAVLKRGATAYEIVDPRTRERTRVTEATAALVQPFAVSFYRPLPADLLRGWDLIRFGLRGAKRDLWTIVAMGVLIGLLGMVAPYFSGQILDSLIPSADRPQLLQFTVGLIVAAFGTLAFELVRAVAVLRLAGTMDSSAQAGVIDRLLNLPSTFFRPFAAGDLADRSLGIGQIRQAITQSGTDAIVNTISVGIMFLFLFTFDWRMALAALVPLGLAVGLPSIANVWQLRFQRELFALRGRISGLLLQLFNGITKLRVAGAEDRAFREWSTRFARQRRLAYRAGRVTNAVAVFNQIVPVLASGFLFGVFAYLRAEALRNHGDFRMTTGQFVAFFFTFSNILSSLVQVSAASLDLMIVLPLAERLRPIVETPPEIDAGKTHPGELSGEIQVWHVTFRYQRDGPTILKDVSLHLRPGEYLALVGGSGSGKSTLLRVLLGFERPEAGSLFYDGQDLSSLDLREVRQQIGVVLQSSRLMPTDIYRNIIGSTNLGLDAAWEAARLAGLERDIKEMPMGMQTIVSEGGSTFSGGQRQRLMIARALVRKPRILFFDEATSALDNETQRIVTESLSALQATRVVIAHRLSTIIHADRIVVLQNGEIVQSGRYEELLNEAGPFADLALRQIA